MSTLLINRSSTRITASASRQYARYYTSTIATSTLKSTKYPDLQAQDLLPNGTPDYVRLILTSRVYDVIKESPLTPAVSLSHKTGASVFLKREDLLPVFSFKLRGAYNMIAKLDPATRSRGVICCSAGNHAQGVAYAAKVLGIPATIVMPVGSSAIKYQNVARLGANIVLHGEDFDGAKQECDRLAELQDLTIIPTFDHPYVIAGQGTAAMEILRQTNGEKISAVFCAVGGAGLISGVGSYLKRIAPHIKIIGVETYDADTLYQSLDKRERITLPTVGAFADGTAIKTLGEENFRITSETVDEVIRVSTDELCASIKDIFEDSRSVVEPSGALAVAGMKRYIQDHPEIDHSDATYVSMISGANMNFDRLRFVAERAMLGEGKEVSMLITIPDTPDSFQQLQNIIHPRGVTEFSYRYNCLKKPINSQRYADIYASFSVTNRDKEITQVTDELKHSGFSAIDISQNELAKSHARYMVGGVADLDHERLFSFEFPERPGALTKFLACLHGKWKLTLFHYRNQGQDVGKVLIGFNVVEEERETFQRFLEKAGYIYIEETENVVYQKLFKP